MLEREREREREVGKERQNRRKAKGVRSGKGVRRTRAMTTMMTATVRPGTINFHTLHLPVNSSEKVGICA